MGLTQGPEQYWLTTCASKHTCNIAHNAIAHMHHRTQRPSVYGQHLVRHCFSSPPPHPPSRLRAGIGVSRRQPGVPSGGLTHPSLREVPELPLGPDFNRHAFMRVRGLLQASMSAWTPATQFRAHRTAGQGDNGLLLDLSVVTPPTTHPQTAAATLTLLPHWLQARR